MILLYKQTSSGLFKILLTIYLFSVFTNPSTRVGYDTRWIFKQSLTGLNSEFSFS